MLHQVGSPAALVEGNLLHYCREIKRITNGMPLANALVAMVIHHAIVFAACLLLANAARAQDTQEAVPLPAVGDVVYKGFVGKALDAVPMDPEERVILQRTNAVVSGTLSVRTLAAWLGLTHPVLLAAGVVWGLYAASNIAVAEVKASPDRNRAEPIEPAQIALLPPPPLRVVAEAAR